MTVKELIEELQGFRPELEIFHSSDPEGNRFRPIDGVFVVDDEGDGNWDGEAAVIYPK